uniref:Uncharacterized protein n=2 Tax=Cacopsylla melanoneura TaxID=428564 RepID=A0A8D9DSV3_9HEMI
MYFYVFMLILCYRQKKKLKKGVLMKCCCNGSGTKEISKGNKLRGGVFYWVKIPFRDSESISYVPVLGKFFPPTKQKCSGSLPARKQSKQERVSIQGVCRSGNNPNRRE